MRYRCADCQTDEIPPLLDLARVTAAAAHRGGRQPDGWFVPVMSWPRFQAEVVAWLLRDGRCHRHAAELAALVVVTIQRIGEAGGEVPAELLEVDGGGESLARRG